MEDECKVVLDAGVHAESRTQVKPGLKLSAALLAFTLCLAAAATVLVFNSQAKGQGVDGDNFDLRHTLRQISNVRAAIHLQGKYNPHRKTSVEWKSQVDQSHSQGGLELDNNEIVIPRNGLYFVYSQASFRVNCSSSRSDSDAHVSHTVKRWSSSYGNDDARKSYKTILHSIRSACQMKDGRDGEEEKRWFTAVYMGAVFNLREGDRLQTRMEEKMLPGLEDDAGKTFFGVFAL